MFTCVMNLFFRIRAEEGEGRGLRLKTSILMFSVWMFLCLCFYCCFCVAVFSCLCFFSFFFFSFIKCVLCFNVDGYIIDVYTFDVYNVDVSCVDVDNLDLLSINVSFVIPTVMMFSVRCGSACYLSKKNFFSDPRFIILIFFRANKGAN